MAKIMFWIATGCWVINAIAVIILPSSVIKEILPTPMDEISMSLDFVTLYIGAGIAHYISKG
jgi:hypothetical protein